MSSRILVKLVVLLSALGEAHSWQQSAWRKNSLRPRGSSLSVASKESTELTSETHVPYVIARGDGTTGGGGLPMPNIEEEEDDGLTRPKVGAEMPKGRPSWFHVPAPSQGTLDSLLEFVSPLFFQY